MYLFVYKTTHINGRYYIGRHCTNNLEDGYLGSGRWVLSVNDKSELSREIIATASSFDELVLLEEKYIEQHYDDPLNMNYKKASIGWTSEDSSNTQNQRVENRTHNFLDGSIPSKTQKRRVENGTHNFLGKDHAGIKSNKKRLANGTHNFQKRPDGSSISSDRVAKGTHNFLNGATNPGSIANKERAKNGTHYFQQPWVCPHCGKAGKGPTLFKRWHGDNCRNKSTE